MHKVTRLAPLAAIGMASLTGAVACGDDDSSSSLPPEIDGGWLDSDTTDATGTDSTDESSGNIIDLPDGSVGETSSDESADGGVTGNTDGGDGGTVDLPTISSYLKNSSEFTVLAAALADAELEAALEADGELTLFAPTDEAFALLPQGLWESLSAQQRADLLLYHVVEGSLDADAVVDLDKTDTLFGEDVKVQVTSNGVYLNGLTKVTTTDIETANGVIHVVDSVLVPGPFPGTVADVLAAYPRLSILFGAAADVSAELSEDDITLFAPTDEAFLGVDLDGVGSLDSVVLYHSLSDSLDVDDLEARRSARSAAGGFIGVKVDDGIKLNDGKVLANLSYTDIKVASGEQGSTIHLIDKVLTPPPSIAEVAAELELTALVDALGLATVIDTDTTFAAALGGEGTFTVFAPSNDAFDAVSAIGFGLDLGNVLGAHVIEGVFDSKAVLDAIDDEERSPETLSGAAQNTLGLSVLDNTVVINSLVQVTATDIPASNGIIQLVDSVIVPSDIEFPGNIVAAVSAYPLLSALAEATANAEDADVADVLSGAGPFTLFAPINSAFDGVDTSSDLSAVLTFHAVADAYDSEAIAELDGVTEIESLSGADLSVDPAALTVEGVAIIGTDLRASNGVIHVINDVLTPPAD